MSSETTASLAWWVSLAGFAANASVPVGELDPTVGIWTDASLEPEGHGNLLETRAAPGSMGLFLSLKTLPGCTLVIEELFFGSRLCLTLLPPQWFPTGGNTAADLL